MRIKIKLALISILLIALNTSVSGQINEVEPNDYGESGILILTWDIPLVGANYIPPCVPVEGDDCDPPPPFERDVWHVPSNTSGNRSIVYSGTNTNWFEMYTCNSNYDPFTGSKVMESFVNDTSLVYEFDASLYYYIEVTGSPDSSNVYSFSISDIITPPHISSNSPMYVGSTIEVPDSSAILELESATKGFLPPRMTSEERDAINNPAPGLMIYCTDCLEMQMYNDTAWTNMIGLPPSDPPIPTTTIGTQTWMSKNLDVGTMINGNEEMTNNAILEKYCYDNDPDNCTLYGALYMWDEMMQYVTAEGTQGICPSGFHLPTDYEWKTLEIHLGMTQSQADAFGSRGTDQGSQLAGNEPLWHNGVLDMNANFGTSGFLALPGGYRDFDGAFYQLSFDCGYWSSSENSTYDAWIRVLYYYSSKVLRANSEKMIVANSVRCVMD